MGPQQRELGEDPVGPSGRLRWRSRLGRMLSRWGKVLDPTPEPPSSPPAPLIPPRPVATPPASPAAAATNRLPGVRKPLSVEQAVRRRDLTVLRREAADALAALGAAHALVASARFTQLQELRQEAERKDDVSGEDLATLAADYLGWQSDQVRLFDALSMVLSMRVPPAPALELIDPAVREAAQAHLASLTVEYQRRLLDHQFGSEPAAAEGNG